MPMLTCVGSCNFNVLDGGIQGVPCKLYYSEGSWSYKAKPKKGSRNGFLEDRNAKFRASYQVGMDGLPIHSESHFLDTNDDGDERTVDVEADYGKDLIKETISRNGLSEKRTLFPAGGMEQFAAMFDPIMSQGLIQQSEMDCIALHPYTGDPYTFKIKVRSRFMGDFFSLPQAGYCLDVDGAESDERLYLTRQGQLLKVDLPNRFFAFQLEEPLAPERMGWGSFKVSDWDKTTDITNPERPVYHTWIVPVMFKNPNILIPVPCALTD